MLPLLLLTLCLPQTRTGMPAAAQPHAKGYPRPVLNEIMASNGATIADEDGDFSDWIELRNQGLLPIDLAGWSLTDDPDELAKWQFPSTLIPAGGYLVVFASDKDRSISGAELHTNFKLKSGGEFLALVRPDGATLESALAPSFPALGLDQSYGMPTDAGAFALLNAPTPASQNTIVALPAAEFSQQSGLFAGSIALELSAPLPVGSEIRYVVGDEEPNASSPIYTAPIDILSSSRVRARVTLGNSLGPTADAYYTLVEPDVMRVTSTLPIVVIDTFGATLSNNGQYRDSFATFVDRDGATAGVAGTPDYHGRMALRIRGSSSAGNSFPKKGYRAELQNAAGEDLDANLFGLGSESDWVLYAPGRMDRNLIANPFLYSVSETLGLYSMNTQFCELYLNDDGGSVGAEDYDGIYIVTESIKIGPNRLDLANLAPGDTIEPEVTGGYIFSIDRDDDGEHAFHTSSGFPNNNFSLNIVKPGLEDLVPEQIEWVEQHFDNFEDALYGPDFADPSIGYAAYIDTPSWIDQHILRVLSMDPDALVLSNIFHKDKNSKFIHSPLWDVDRSMESDDSRDDFAGTIAARSDKFDWEWWGRLFEDPAFRANYAARWFTLREDQLSTEELFLWIDNYHSEIAEAYPREDSRWGAENNYGSRFGDLQGEIDHLKNWLSTRLEILDAFLSYFPLVNLALSQPATQSTTEGNHVASRGRDGRRTAYAEHSSVIITLEEDEPWWEVDLGAIHPIEAITLCNRWPSEPDVASNFHILVSDTPFASSDLSTVLAQPGVTDIHYPGLADRLLTFPVSDTGRYVRVQLEDIGTPRRLSFAELEVLRVAR